MIQNHFREHPVKDIFRPRGHDVAVVFSGRTRDAYVREAIRREETYTFDSAWDERRTWMKGEHAYLAPGRDGIRIDGADGARVVLLGGAPFPEELTMWWNFVARSRDEITAAWRQWTDGDDRFPAVASPLPRTEVDPPHWS